MVLVVCNITFDLFFVVALLHATSFNVTSERGDTSLPNVLIHELGGV